MKYKYFAEMDLTIGLHYFRIKFLTEKKAILLQAKNDSKLPNVTYAVGKTKTEEKMNHRRWPPVPIKFNSNDPHLGCVCIMPLSMELEGVPAPSSLPFGAARIRDWKPSFYTFFLQQRIRTSYLAWQGSGATEFLFHGLYQPYPLIDVL